MRSLIALPWKPGAPDVSAAFENAVRSRSPSILRAFIREFPEQMDRRCGGLTVLHRAVCVEYSADNIAALIEAGANPHALSDDGETPLQYAIREGWETSAKALERSMQENPLG
ncbi:ankyrin repeat domain-containing protein [Variovorax terrae]|uniref:Ankyrin repeat domain-containing protein n=1 Tax=Variovorax terrae TaxID=2923278 RepID=A0A9X2APT2_9BURK|nr:ankyrin repeat domain-containing protein [Variovorax terrae]MCJ0766128.1 ankyrin repeat domain-containing protein [Variovorax terrae]